MGLTDGQKRCVDTLDDSLVVAAGAGSGKTFTLTERIVHAFEEGFVTDIGEVCAITFTRKAAAELKSRIKGKLRATGFIDQALKVDEAWISTIHGMCARILRAHAVELGVDPAFSVVEGAKADDYLSRAVDIVLARAQASGASARLDALFDEYPARSAGFGDSVESMLRRLVDLASAQSDGIASFVLPGITLSPLIALSEALEVLEGLLGEATTQNESEKRDGWIEVTSSQVDAVREALSSGDVDCPGALGLLGGVRLAKTFGSKEYKAHVDAAKGRLGSIVMELRLAQARPHLDILVELAGQALAEYNRFKWADGALDNNDLLVLAARAISDHPTIARNYTDRFKLVMVDEFQDTDQMQVDMIKMIAGPGACRLCTVGDAQQSIYRFRGADVSVYRRHLGDVASSHPESVIELSDNFRSHRDILSFVDRVFEKPDMFGGEFMSLAAGRDEGKVKSPFKGSATRVIVQHTTNSFRGADSQTVCEVAARRIAAVFAELRDKGHSAGDMVVLLGRMAHAGVYAQALRDAGLSCVISGGSVFSQTPEAQMVRELVHALANPLDTQATFNVVTSPLFSLTASDLLVVGGIGGIVHPPRTIEHVSAQLECALRVMGAAWSQVRDQPISRILEMVLVESGWLSRLENRGPEGQASAANAFKAIRMIGSIETAGAYGPLTVMRRFDDTLESAKEAPGALSVSGGDSVQIMTIHASKGLEFPIVAVAEMKNESAPRSRLLASSIDGKVYLSLDAGQSGEDSKALLDAAAVDAVRDHVLGLVAGEDELSCAVKRDAGALHRRLALREFIAVGDAEEAKRLLYVALTRAKEALVVSCVGKRTSKDALGIPNNALAGVLRALDPESHGLGDGRTSVDFGGSLPAIVDVMALEKDDARRSPNDIPLRAYFSTEASSGSSAGAVERGEAEPMPCETVPNAHLPGKDLENGEVAGSFIVPAASDVFRRVYREEYRPAHEGIFSYSSVADASHEGDLLARLADGHVVAVDEPAEEGLYWPNGTTLDSMLVFEGEVADFEPASRFDDDRATDLGTAFHRLAEYAASSRGQGSRLDVPPEDRIEAVSRVCKLDGHQRHRLNRALDRWFASDVAREAESLANLAAEVPFFIALGDEFLEGEIDLLGFDESGVNATVVDYKTGGSADESEDELRLKHVLQAACYAYAVMLQGAKRVDAVFVRVEQGRLGNPDQPQCVRYRFTADDAPFLLRAIGEARSLSAGRALTR